MKRTIIVTINGIIFNVEDDAYQLLENYLNRLTRYFSINSGQSEIIADIEARIAELLQSRISDVKQSVNRRDIEEIIKIMGSPEDIADADDSNSEDKASNSRKPKARLYRDPDHAILGGVCAGLGYYFHFDPILFRIIFIFLCFTGGISLIVYPILWIAVPKAKTAAQKLEMRGENINVETIEKAFHENYENLKRNFDSGNTNALWVKVRDLFTLLTTFIVRVCKIIWHIVRISTGTILIIGSMSILTAVITTFYFSTFMLQGFVPENFNSLQEVLHHIFSPLQSNTMLILAIIVISVPLILIIYLSIKLLVRFRAKDKWMILSGFLIWVLAVILFVTVLSVNLDSLKREVLNKDTVSKKTYSSKSIYLKAQKITAYNDESIRMLSRTYMFGIDRKNSKTQIFGIAQINVEPGANNLLEIDIEKETRGRNTEDAVSITKQMHPEFSIVDSVLSINPAFSVPTGQTWHFQKAVITLKIPARTSFYIDPSIAPFVKRIGNADEYDTDTLENRYWHFNTDGIPVSGKEK